MRLWHQELIPHLPMQWLSGQHRECCALRGNGWGKKHATVDYVFTHPYYKLYAYHAYVMEWIIYRNPESKIDRIWFDHDYRGKVVGYDESDFTNPCSLVVGGIIYPEHDEAYLQECIDNLAGKGITINNLTE